MITLQGDISGNIVMVPTGRHLRSNLYYRSARISTRKTLDVGSSFTHSGFNVADSEIQFGLTGLSQADELKLKDMLENETTVFLSCSDGYFSGAIKNLKLKNGEAALIYSIKEKRS